MRILLMVATLVFAGTAALSQEKQVALGLSGVLEGSELWGYALPRFKLKTGIQVEVVDVTQADIAISTTPVYGAPLRRADLMMIGTTGDVFAVELRKDTPFAIRFYDWLLSDIGQRTLTSFEADGAQMFFPVNVDELVLVDPIMTGNAGTGEETSIRKCGRCHVVSERNKYGGIESTPSFPALRTLNDWRQKFAVFWTLNPHPSFTQIEGITEPFDPAHPPHIYPIFLTQEEVENIGAFMETITPADLGEPLRTN